MDCRTRPTVARRIAGALALSLCAAGCGGNSYVSFSSGGSSAVTSVPAGTSASTATVQTSSSAGSSYFALGMMLLLAYDNQKWTEELAKYGYVTVPVPPLDETRKVNTQDCSKPIEDPFANLKCR